MKQNSSLSFRVAPADKEGLKILVKHGIFRNYSDAARETMRRGTKEIMTERGIEYAKES